MHASFHNVVAIAVERNHLNSSECATLHIVDNEGKKHEILIFSAKGSTLRFNNLPADIGFVSTDAIIETSAK